MFIPDYRVHTDKAKRGLLNLTLLCNAVLGCCVIYLYIADIMTLKYPECTLLSPLETKR